MTDMNEARSLSYRRDLVDIYSNSWGPYDSGANVEGPGHLTKLAFKNGAAEVTFYLAELLDNRVLILCMVLCVGTEWKGIHICMG